jgi:hypothetical protein
VKGERDGNKAMREGGRGGNNLVTLFKRRNYMHGCEPESVFLLVVLLPHSTSRKRGMQVWQITRPCRDRVTLAPEAQSTSSLCIFLFLSLPPFTAAAYFVLCHQARKEIRRVANDINLNEYHRWRNRENRSRTQRERGARRHKPTK